MEFKIRGHELVGQYRYFVLDDKTVLEEMKNPYYKYGEENAEAYKEFLQNLKPDDLMTIVDTFGDLCYLIDGGCPYKEKDECTFFPPTINIKGLDNYIAKSFGIEINKPYKHSDLINILKNADTPLVKLIKIQNVLK